ncbi:hypothetical protein KK137_06910 [Croceibacterium sp. LX-88]|uniref:Uncharacterized protein n=1 Tax=Croceibacterium selenioxidans TaxID=2838833 RepID=A0ABS5W2S9_9SPHN|nr:hypothetical protein [Croceibacterium selenioxidans]MBT2134061.1 hypothetical protein [Croceibacterium selenioxidans]
MSEEDIRYYEKRLAEERARAEAEDDEHLRAVHARFVQEIEGKILRIKQDAQFKDDLPRTQAPSDLHVAT